MNFMRFVFAFACFVSTVAVVAPLAHAGQFDGFSNVSRRTSTVKTPAAPADSVVDKTSGRYLQSVGRRVADRPLACPPAKRKAKR